MTTAYTTTEYDRTASGTAATDAHICLNIGCGPVQPDGWVNIDSSNRAWLASRLNRLDRLLVRLRLLPPTEFNSRTRVLDVRKRIPFADNSVKAIYSGEMLEHLTVAECARFLAESIRVLAPGGILRVRVPDNYRFWKNYTREFETTYTLPRDQWNTAHTRWTEMFFQNICIRRPWLGSMGHFHKWMYDEVSLILAFEQAGFGEVARRTMHDSRIPDVALVETHEDLTVEGVKPA